MPKSSPEHHVAEIAKAANYNMINIKIASKYRDSEMFRMIYTLYIRLRLEYTIII